jgi:uncharacterized delta-60 repeat protein
LEPLCDRRGFAIVRLLPDGRRDHSFSQDGKAVFLLPSSFGAAVDDMALQPNGGILLTGGIEEAEGEVFGALKLSPHGHPDRGFDHDGWITDSLSGGPDGANACELQPDGKILLSGAIGGAFGVARYTRRGHLDDTFGASGWVSTPFPPGAGATQMALQTDGKIVLTGTVPSTTLGQSDVGVIRYTSDGDLDGSFSGDGTRVFGFSDDGQDEAQDVIVDPRGRLLVAGGLADDRDQLDDFAIARLRPNGSLDTRFGGDGRYRIDFAKAFGKNSSDNAVRILISENRLLVAGPIDSRNIFGVAALLESARLASR